uniref:Uncharacterized protein n=1 Tax=Panagrolaimus sp. ES5 TaxID=591445 RepID=A0AC34FIZ1_9BILA
MLLQYGQQSHDAQNKIREEIGRRHLRRARERMFEETNDPNLGVAVFEDDTLIVGRVCNVAEKDMPRLHERIVSQSHRIDDSIDSLITKISQTPPPKNRGRPRKIDNKLLAIQKPSIPITLQLPSLNGEETSGNDAEPSSTFTPPAPKKRRPRKRKAEILEVEEEQIIVLSETTQKRVSTGFYDQQHKQMIYETIQPKLSYQDDTVYNEEEEEYLVDGHEEEEMETNEDEQLLERIKREMG